MSNDIPDSNPFPQRRMSARLNCPHCHNPIELVADSVDEDVLCPSCGSAVHLDAGPMLTWDKKKLPALGQFQLIEAVGRGAFGTVYKAFDQQLQRTVAVKIPRSGVLETDEDEDRFVREARNVAQLRHPGIVAIHSVGRSDAFPYLVSEFVEGVTLSEYLTAKRFSIKESARLIREICIALQHAHSQGVVHRDLKPSNIMLTPDGQPRIMDFGVAKRNAGEITMTIDGQILGTPAYMSPEQAGGLSHQADAQSDIYSVGVILFQLLTGELPFRGDVQMLLYQVQYEEPPSPRKLNHQVPRDLETICLKCMAKEPKRRYASAGDLADDVQRYLDGIPILARPVTRIEHAWRWCRRNPVVAGLSTTAVISLALTAVVSTLAYKETSRLVSKETLAREKAEKLAESNARLAVAERESAERSLRLLDANAQLTEKERQQTKLAERNLYAAHMTLAQVAWENNQIAETLRLLQLHRPNDEVVANKTDLRGFEWFFWDRRSRTNQMTLRHSNPHKSLRRAIALYGVAYSPEGRRVVSISEDGTAKVWDARTGKNLLTIDLPIEGHDRPVSVAYSPDATKLAVAYYQGRIQTFDAKTGLLLLTMNGDAYATMHISYSPDGNTLASAGADQEVTIWNATSGKEAAKLKGHTSTVLSCVYSPDGDLLASGSMDGTVRIWNAKSGQMRSILDPRDGSWKSCVCFSPDGKNLAAGSYKMIRVWDATTGQPLFSMSGHSDQVFSISYSLDGARLVSSSSDNTLKLWNANTGEDLRTFKGHEKFALSVAFCPDGEHIVSAGGDGTVKIWDTKARPEALRLSGASNSSSIQFSPDGRRVVTSHYAGAKVRIYDVLTGECLFKMRGEENVPARTAVYSTDGSRVAAGSDDGTIAVWNAINGDRIFMLRGHSAMVTSLAFSQNGQRLASASMDHSIKLWNPKTGEETITLKGHTAWVNCIAYSPDGCCLASASGDGTVKMWDAETGKELSTLSGHRGDVTTLAFRPDGKRLASAGEDESIIIWEPSARKGLLVLKGHTGRISSVVFTPDGQRLASASHDYSVKIWDATDAATGEVLMTIKALDSVNGVVFAPDGRRLGIASAETTIIWDATNVDVPLTSFPTAMSSGGRHLEHEAETALLEKIEMAAKRITEYPNEPPAKLELASLWYKMGDLLLDHGETSKAIEYFLRYQQYLEKYAENEPCTVAIQTTLVESYEKVGGLFQARGQPEKGLDQFQRLNQFAKALVESDPEEVVNHQRWQFSHGRIGGVLVQLGRWPESVEYFEKTLELAKANCIRFPQDRQCRINLFSCHCDVGKTRVRQGRITDAIQMFRRALDLGWELAESKPDDPYFASLIELRFAIAALGDIEYQRFQFAAARKIYSDGLSALDAYVSRNRLTNVENELNPLRMSIENCDRAERSILDLDFALSQDKLLVPQQLALRVHSFLVYASSVPEDVPVAVREKWSTGILSTELLREAIRTADAFRTLEPTVAATLYDASCLFSFCLKGLIKLDVPEKESLASQLQSKALETLKAAIAAGWNNADHTAADTDLEPLRELLEFKTMLEELRAKPK